MQVIERKEMSFMETVDNVLSRKKGLFQSKELRNRVAAEIRRRGYNVTRRVVVSQQLHPEYVTDYVGTLETGFGNTQYQTYWSKLYALELL